jgi:acetylornithine aminotransferase
LIGLELDSPAAPVRAELLQRGIITGSADDPNVVRLMPPLNIPLDALDDFATTLEMSLDAVGA